MRGERLLVFAPHPDDEILGCGGVLALSARMGLALRIIVVSDGQMGVVLGTQPDVRRDETLRALELLAVEAEAVEFWNYPDRSIPIAGPITTDYLRVVREFQPTRIFLPAPSEEHADHRAVTRGAINALISNWSGGVWFYETTQPMPKHNILQDISEVAEAKREAMACHASQVSQFDYLRHSEYLGGLRGLQSGTTHAEAFLSYDWDGGWQDFFYPQPLISVVLRSSRNLFLHEALRSLQRQRYTLIEVILVWFGEQPPELDNFNDLDIRITNGIANRGANLNRGIAAARGQYVAFLDEDDVLLPEHFGILLPELMSDPTLDVCYAATRLVACDCHDDGIVGGRVLRTMNSPYQRGQLLLRNCIAIHTALVRRAVFNTEQFDEALHAYEDWEFWARLEQHGYRFMSLEDVTTEYRLFGLDLDAEDPISDLHMRKGYLEWSGAVLSLILKRSSTASLFDLEKLLGGSQSEAADSANDLAAARDENLSLKQEMLQLKEGFRRCRAAVGSIVGALPGPEATVSQLIGLALPHVKISLVCPIFNSDRELLAQALQSVQHQSYANWELCLVDDASDQITARDFLELLKERYSNDKRVKLARLSKHGGIVAATSAAIESATGEYIGFLDHDDLLHPDALLEVALSILDHNHPSLLYTDSRVIDHAGTVLHTNHKPGWSPESLLSFNYINHFVVVRREALSRVVGSFSSSCEGVQDWDLLLRLSDFLKQCDVVHIPKALYDWRASETSLAYRSSSKPWTLPVARGVLEDGIRRKLHHDSLVSVELSSTGFIASWECDFPRIQVIVPTHSNAKGLAICLSGLLDQTDYPSLSVQIIANRCESLAINSVLSQYKGRSGVTIARDDRPFNWSALNNTAAENCTAPLLLFLNDDTEVLDSSWLKRMVRYLSLPGVGAVGALLYYPDGTLQHNGVRTDPEWIADNIRDVNHTMLAAQMRNVSAVTGACLLTPFDVFKRVGGFDENLPVNYNDVDYCLALRAAGYRIVQANDVKLSHHELKTRGYPEATLWETEKRILREKWGDALIERYLPRQDTRFNETLILRID